MSYIGGRGGDENNKYYRRDAWTRITTRSIELIESIRRVGLSCIDESALPPSLGHTDTPPRALRRDTIDDSPNPVHKHSTTTPTSPAAEGWCHSYPPPPRRTSPARFHSLLRVLRDSAPLLYLYVGWDNAHPVHTKITAPQGCGMLLMNRSNAMGNRKVYWFIGGDVMNEEISPSLPLPTEASLFLSRNDVAPKKQWVFHGWKLVTPFFLLLFLPD